MRRFVPWVLGVSLGVLIGAFVCRVIDIDKCLDAGGRWNYAAGLCEGGPGEPK
jgi:hypothetical protein